jgi:hypothetical protein
MQKKAGFSTVEAKFVKMHKGKNMFMLGVDYTLNYTLQEV